jgi:hypothetical protein
MTELILGAITMEQTMTHEAIKRANRYDVIDYLNQLTNRILVAVPQGEDRDLLLTDLKRAKELVNNL